MPMVVHIGQSDTAYEEARKILGPDKIIGMTAKTVEQAQMAEKLGADYIGTGAVFSYKYLKRMQKI